VVTQQHLWGTSYLPELRGVCSWAAGIVREGVFFIPNITNAIYFILILLIFKKEQL
jgi:hypothetical protein